MGLINETMSTLFNGVSRQPASVRLPNQVQDAINASFSVETGGFENRNGTTLKASYANLVNGADMRCHFIFRDDAERYVVMVTNGSLHVASLVDGGLRTVNIDSDALAYLNAATVDDFAFTTIADYTMVLNKSVTVARDTANLAPPGTFAAVIEIRQSYGTFVVTVGGHTVSYAIDASAATTAEVSATRANGNGVTSDSAAFTANALYQLLVALGLPNFVFSLTDNYIFVRNPVADFPITLAEGGGYGVLTKDVLNATTDLPAYAVDGMVIQLSATAAASYYLQFQGITGTSKGVWVETTQPGTTRAFDASTMPHQLVRNGDGSFTFSRGNWKVRTAGNDTTVPFPLFVGRTISDMVFFRDRLTLAADETTYLSAVGDYFNMWPQYSTQVLDSDPFGLTCSANTVSLIRYMVPFRKALFLTSDLNQFELTTNGLLTSAQTSLDLSTSYPLSSTVRPLPVGDSIYMVSTIGTYSVVLEYDYDYAYQTSTATDIIEHAHGYLPGNIVLSAGDAVARTLLFVPEGSPRNAVFVYQYFFQGDTRTQAAWHEWQFPSVQIIYGLGIVDGTLWIVAQMLNGDIHLLNMNLGRGVSADYRFRLCMDQTIVQMGVYDAPSDTTSWTLPYVPIAGSVVGLMPSPAFGPYCGIPTATTIGAIVRTSGDWSAQGMVIGQPYGTTVEFSKLWAHDADKTALLDGRAQIRQMILNYTDTAAFNVTIFPEGRAGINIPFTGRTLGRSDNQPGTQPIRDGTFKFNVSSRSNTTAIQVSATSLLPFTIVSATWSGFYNSITR